MPTNTRTALLALATGLALALTACGGGDAAAPSAGAPASSAAPTTRSDISTEHGDADLAFVTGMHPHHQGALDMAELAGDRAGSGDVKALARRIAAAQAPEMARLEAMAAAWGTPMEAAGGHGGGHGDDAALERLTGAAFDRAFLQRMTAHHESALPMARKELAAGTNPQAQALAQEILDAQQAEIAEMRGLLAER